MPTIWHELQLMAWLSDSRGSKYSILPSSTLAGVAALPGSGGALAGIGLNRPWACFIKAVCDHAWPVAREARTISETSLIDGMS
jgi:hypothetical protein